MKYSLMVMNMGIDGLVSEHSILVSDNADECFQRSIEFEEDNPELTRVVCVEDDGKTYIWEQLPYPRVKEPETPAFYRARMNAGPWRWQKGEAPWQKAKVA